MAQGFPPAHLSTRPSCGQTDFLRALASKENAQDRLELVEADLLAPGSFDTAIAGCDYVLHTASPFFIKLNRNPDEVFIRPAVEGTTNVLGAVAKAGTVKRVVLTSSTAAVHGFNNDKVGAPYTEADWNETSSRTVRALQPALQGGGGKGMANGVFTLPCPLPERRRVFPQQSAGGEEGLGVGQGAESIRVGHHQPWPGGGPLTERAGYRLLRLSQGHSRRKHVPGR